MRMSASLRLISLLAVCAVSAQSQEPASAAVVKPVLTRGLPDLPGKEVTMVTVEYPPGFSSTPHRHNADTFVYVLEGAIIMQVDGGKEVTLRAGETFYESPTDIHSVGRNASATAPAKFLVFFVKNLGASTTHAVP